VYVVHTFHGNTGTLQSGKYAEPEFSEFSGGVFREIMSVYYVCKNRVFLSPVCVLRSIENFRGSSNIEESLRPPVSKRKLFVCVDAFPSGSF